MLFTTYVYSFDSNGIVKITHLLSLFYVLPEWCKYYY